MLKRTNMVKILLISFLVLAFLGQATQAYAWGGGGRERHYYRGGHWYRHSWLGFDIAVSALAIGALIESLPPRYDTVVVGGAPYYYYDGTYCRPYPSGGYIVVPAPVVTQPVVAAPEAAQYQVQAPEATTINIPNSRGGYTAVTLRRSGRGFVGPQGEYYAEFPTVEQLKVMYGK